MSSTAIPVETPSAAMDPSQVPTELQCLYTGKRCSNVRSLKRDGSLHRLCTHHREVANKNQWMVDQRRRQRRAREHQLQMAKAIAVGAVANMEMDIDMDLDATMALSDDDPMAIASAIQPLDGDELDQDWDEADIAFLQRLLLKQDSRELDARTDIAV